MIVTEIREKNSFASMVPSWVLVLLLVLILAAGDVRGDNDLDNDLDNDSDGVVDFDFNCQERVENGECNSSPREMIIYCLQECFESDDFGAVGFYSYTDDDDDEEEEYIDEETRRKHHLRCDDIHNVDDYEDEDVRSCVDLASSGECAMSPEFMLFQCAKSCFVCREFGVETFPIGKRQEIHENDVDNDEAIQNTANVIVETFAYISKIMSQPEYVAVRAMCRNDDEYCSSLAAAGLCEPPENFEELPEDDEGVELYEFMIDGCSAACQTCELLISDEDASIIKDCVPDQKTNIFGPGDLNRMFERIVGESDEGEDAVVPKSDVNILSRPTHPRGYSEKDDDPTDYLLGPWVVTLDNFLTHEECDRLIKLGSMRGYERSVLEEEKDYDEEELAREKNSEDAYRTSQNTWCQDECYEDPVVQRIIAKLGNATGIPDTNAEYLQLLSYVPGQYYKEHHDINGDDFYQFSGPRMITFFLYLNDVEEGGATRLTDLKGDDSHSLFLDVQPKKGMALIWPSVLNENPMMMDERTYHEALTVKKGRKYGANAWFYLRTYKGNDCDINALDAIGQKYGEEESEDDIYSSETDLHDEL